MIFAGTRRQSTARLLDPTGSGHLIGLDTDEAVDKERTFESLCDEELLVSKTGPTRWNTLEVMNRTSRRFEIRVTRCLYHELAQSLGNPEITPVVCQIDNAAFNSYLPDSIVFNRGGPNRRIADGQLECNFIWESRVEGSV